MKRVWLLSLIAFISFPLTGMEVTKTDIKNFNDLLHVTTETKIFGPKKRVNELEALAAEMVKKAVGSVENIETEFGLPKSDQSLRLTPSMIGKIKTKMKPFVQRGDEKVESALKVSTFDFVAQIGKDKERLNAGALTPAFAELYKKPHFREQLLSQALELLDKQYKKVLQAIATLKGNTDPFPRALSWDSLVIFGKKVEAQTNR